MNRTFSWNILKTSVKTAQGPRSVQHIIRRIRSCNSSWSINPDPWDSFLVLCVLCVWIPHHACTFSSMWVQGMFQTTTQVVDRHYRLPCAKSQETEPTMCVLLYMSACQFATKVHVPGIRQGLTCLCVHAPANVQDPSVTNWRTFIPTVPMSQTPCNDPQPQRYLADVPSAKPFVLTAKICRTSPLRIIWWRVSLMSIFHSFYWLNIFEKLLKNHNLQKVFASGCKMRVINVIHINGPDNTTIFACNWEMAAQWSHL